MCDLQEIYMTVKLGGGETLSKYVQKNGIMIHPGHYLIVIYTSNIPGLALRKAGLTHHVRLYKVLVHF